MKLTHQKALLAASLVALAGCSSDSKDKPVLPPVSEGETIINTPEVIVKAEDNPDLQRQTITLGATGDMHGYIRAWDYAQHAEAADTSFAKIQSVMNAERAKDENIILIDLGDTVQGNSAELFNDYPTHPVVEAMIHMEYDVWVPGNHEFDFDRSFIDRNLVNFDGAVISANVYWNEEHGGAPYMRGHQIFQINGATVAVIGVTPSLVPQWQASQPDNYRNLEFRDELATISATVDQVIEAHQPDVVIGAFHLSRNESGIDCGVHCLSEELVDKFDVMFMGHEHAQFIEQTTVDGQSEVGQSISSDGALTEDKGLSGVYNADNRHTKVKIIEPGRFGWALAKAEIELERDDAGQWQIVDTTLSNVRVREEGEDDTMVAMFDEVHQLAIEDATTPIGTVEGNFTFSETGMADEATNTAMTNGRLYSTIHHAKVADMPLVDLIQYVQIKNANAGLEALNSPYRVEVSAAALFSDQSNLVDGQKYEKRHSAELYRYDNNLMAVRILGEHLKDYMEWSYNYLKGYSEGDLTVAFNGDIPSFNYDLFDGEGFYYTVDLSKQNREEDQDANRIQEGERIEILEIGGAPFDPEAIYTLAVNNYRFGDLVRRGWVRPVDVLYDSVNEQVFAIRDMLTAMVGEYSDQYGALKADQFINQNWHFVQYGQADEQGQVAEPGAILQARADDAEGQALWSRLQNGEICVIIGDGSKGGNSIGEALNPADADSYFENPNFDPEQDISNPEYLAALIEGCKE
ncbi:bifunctional metallophosphatase/5'-nucleotidase [Ferrimonas balearica]|uniref:bifunctional metallophosphatase/5'-nucleotidase n=1 Tax=Ferrimonas balearica TaxID=44012 RepID=UPI001C996582|nr:5'-nucleotidase C-terminal domain-containing protein [Ferrimonas balearica]MBY5991018.1 5'-nucleotidase C-terminal domain-containing protein [Ferrimonas balearica]